MLNLLQFVGYTSFHCFEFLVLEWKILGLIDKMDDLTIRISRLEEI